MILIFIIIACLSISLCVWIALLLLCCKKEILSKILLFLVSFSAGALMGSAFLHLLPEAALEIKTEKIYLITLVAFVFFFFMEKLLYWRHCHKENCQIHTFGYMNLFGDGLHNFIDGLIIATAFLVDIKLGVTTTFAIALHEIPQEISDFGVLLYAGFKKKKALLINFIVALTVVAGGIVGYFISLNLENIISFLLPFAAGGFIYIAASDLMPEIKKETNLRKSIISFLMFMLGIALMFVMK
ncbi:MAG: ZIP family metal transporter [Patescibacteria group bacterium]|nr:ZIP family metal transporter [Patescibacteria group bacterium]MBU1684065.1 ZIP family metal transporter [Patescibacteria group bacterium]MBU1778296.1 ZIP family metal transporter [Patescibacteria group bacterium]